MTDQIGQYRLIDRIASGGMGEVFKAKLRRGAGFEKTVAVKRILPHLASSEEFESRFCAEARLSASLNHANIVHVYDFGTQNGSLFLAMEFIDGVDLGSLLLRLSERGERLGLGLSLLILSQVLRGLDYAHRMTDDAGVSLRLIHRDISPGNILISVEGEVKLTDFGLAHARQSGDDDVFAGKLPYLPPEQVAGEPLDRRSDLYSLGLVFYEMLYGRKAFHESLPREALLCGIRAGAFDLPPDDAIPEEVRTLLRRATATQKSERYPSAREMLDDVERLRDHLKREGEESLSDLVGRLFPDRRTNPAAAPEKTLLAPRPIADTDTPAPDLDVLLSSPETPRSVAVASSRRRILWVFVVLLLALGGAFVWWLQPVYGKLRVTSDPPGAAILLNGVETGRRTPATLSQVPPGVRHNLTLTLSGYETWQGEVAVRGDEVEPVTAVLKRRLRVVQVATQPPGVRVRLNGDLLEGVTPLSTEPLATGTKHLLRLEGEDLIPHQSEFILDPSDEPYLLNVPLESLYRELTVHLEPADATLLRDGSPVTGEPPYVLTGLIPNRPVQLAATHPGFISRQETILPEQQEGPLTLVLSPFTATLRLEGKGFSIMLDGKTAQLPLRLEDVHVRHRLVSVSLPGQSARLVMRLHAGQTRDRIGRWVTQAEMSLDAQPWATVQVDNRPSVTTPQSGILLAPGRHRVVFTLAGAPERHELTLHVQ